MNKVSELKAMIAGLTRKSIFCSMALLSTLSAVLIYIQINSVPRKVDAAPYQQNIFFRVSPG